MILSLENTTNVDISIRASGQFIPALSERVVNPKSYASYSEGINGDDPTLIAQITSGDIVVKVNGVALTSAAALRTLSSLNFLEIAKDGVSQIISPDKINLTGAVTTTVTGDEVEVNVGAKDDDDLSDTVYCIDFNGEEGEFLSLGTEDNKGDETFYTLPFNCKLVAIGYSNKKSGTKFRLRMFKALANQADAFSQALVWEVPQPVRVATIRTGTQTDVTNLTDVTFAVGDKVSLYLQKVSGNEPEHVDLRLYLKVTASPLTDYMENFSHDDNAFSVLLDSLGL